MTRLLASGRARTIVLALLFYVSVIGLLDGCAGGPFDRGRSALRAATEAGWRPRPLAAGPFTLLAVASPDAPGARSILRVYIEGDGLAWASRTRPALDPTPHDPIGLRLALADPAPGRRLYLARPCQFIEAGPDNACATPHWTSHRFSAEVVDAYAALLDRLARRGNVQSLTLVGYSGGGVLATLIAARLQAVDAVVTVAAPVDHDLWSRHHRVSPLVGSLDPLNNDAALAGIPQVHFLGGADTIVPPGLIDRYQARVAAGGRTAQVLVPEASHGCCWAERWPALWRRAASAIASVPPRRR